MKFKCGRFSGLKDDPVVGNERIENAPRLQIGERSCPERGKDGSAGKQAKECLLGGTAEVHRSPVFNRIKPLVSGEVVGMSIKRKRQPNVAIA
jgi:hypothetical protein